MDRPYRLAALLLLFGLVWAGAAPCLCAVEPTAVDHCGGPLPGIRAGHDACGCPCMTSAPAASAERPDAEMRVPPASVPTLVGARDPRSLPARTAPRAADTSPPPPASPPAVLRI